MAGARLDLAATEDPTLERTFRGHRGRVGGLSFSPDMKQLASGASDKCVVIWNFNPTVRAFRYHGHTVR